MKPAIFDIDSAKGLAKSIAVKTGHHSGEKLMSHNPDVCVENLVEVRKFLGGC